MHVAQLSQAADHLGVVPARIERAAKPRPRIHPGDGLNGRPGLADVLAKARLGERVHGSVMVRVVPDQMTG